MDRADYDIVIVGAGIAGGALARALVAQGWRLCLIEAGELRGLSPPVDQGVAGFDARVSALTPASTALLDRLDAWQAVAAARSCPYRHMHVWDADGSGAIDFDCSELGADRLGTIVENRLITGALADLLLSDNRLELRTQRRVVELLRNDAGRPGLVLDDGSELSCELLVGADGALSKLRTLGGFQTREWDYGHQALVCTVETERSHAATAWQRFLSTGPLAFLPLPESAGRHFCSIVWSLEQDEAERVLALDDSAFRSALAEALEHRLGDVLDASPRISHPLRQRHAVDYVQPGLALVGDAAHTLHPLAGQGINLGLQDIAVLAEELEAAAARGDSPGDLAVLRRYQRRRKGENLLMMAAMDGFKRLFGARSLPLRWLRNEGMRLVGDATPLKRRIMRHAMGVR
jgi:2-octaprenylphenol hydroxylase